MVMPHILHTKQMLRTKASIRMYNLPYINIYFYAFHNNSMQFGLRNWSKNKKKILFVWEETLCREFRLSSTGSEWTISTHTGWDDSQFKRRSLQSSHWDKNLFLTSLPSLYHSVEIDQTHVGQMLLSEPQLKWHPMPFSIYLLHWISITIPKEKIITKCVFSQFELLFVLSLHFGNMETRFVVVWSFPFNLSDCYNRLSYMFPEEIVRLLQRGNREQKIRFKRTLKMTLVKSEEDEVCFCIRSKKIHHLKKLMKSRKKLSSLSPRPFKYSDYF